jgi:hypothetical protein
MTPAFWHQIALRVSPFHSTLLKAAAISMPTGLAAIGIAVLYEQPNKWIFLLVWTSCLAIFWSLGLLLIHALFRYPPVPGGTPLQHFSYLWNSSVSPLSAVFYAIWFVGLLLATFVVPVFIIFSNAN